MDYKFCPECGQKLAKDARFCPNCGTKQPDIEINEQASPAPDAKPSSSVQAPDSSSAQASSTNEQPVTAQPHLEDIKVQPSPEMLARMGMPASEKKASNSATASADSSQPEVGQQAESEQSVHQASAQAASDHASQQQFYQQAGQNQNQSRNNQQEQFYQQGQQQGGPQPSPNQYQQSYQQGWRPYNETGQPSLMNSFSLWMHSLGQTNKCMGRADYWWGYLAFLLLYWCAELLVFIVAALLLTVDQDLGTYVAGILGTLVVAFSAYVSIVTMVQRLHDTGHSGWNWLWCLTGIGGIYVLFLLCQPTNWNEQRWVRVNG